MALGSQLKCAKKYNAAVLSARKDQKFSKLDKHTHKVFEQILKGGKKKKSMEVLNVKIT